MAAPLVELNSKSRSHFGILYYPEGLRDFFVVVFAIESEMQLVQLLDILETL
jgi:hypothetical protein